MLNWRRKIPTILTSQEILDRAFHRASKISKQGTVPFDTVKKTDIAKITAIGDTTATTLLKYVRSFPTLEKREDLLSELIDVLVGTDSLKKALSSLTWAAERTSHLQRTYLSRVRRAESIDEVEKARKEFYGRLSSVINQIEKDLKFVSMARDRFKELPMVDPQLPTAVIAGYPNVGKSQLVERISSAKPVIASYPFTTKGIGVGHFKEGWRTYQVVDTPGLLDRQLEERNAIERQAILALKYLADVIVFILDPTETCGYSMAKQLALLESVKKGFPGIPIIEVENKADMLEGGGTRLRISALSGEGVAELFDLLIKQLKQASKDDQQPPIPFRQQ